MSKIVTLTLNPALDIATHIYRFVPEHKMRCGPARRDPGGGGINVARALHRLGGSALAVYSSGGAAGLELQALLGREGVRHHPVPVAASTRENFNVTEDCSGNQYRFVLPGEALTAGECNACVEAAVSELAAGDMFVVSGSLPKGADDGLYARAVASAKAVGATTVIDTQGAALRAAVDRGVGILKASAREFGDLVGRAPIDIPGWRDLAVNLVLKGGAGVIALTLGGDGALLVDKSGAWRAKVPDVQSSTTVGAGDSFLAGLLVRIAAGATHEEALRYAAAAGTAALLASGTGLCGKTEVERLIRGVTITALG